MASVTINRKEVRELLTTLLQGGVQGTVESYQTDPAGRSPLVQIVSSGSLRNDIRKGGSSGPLMVSVHCFVVHADPNSSWTEEDAENAIDDLEYQVVTCLEANQNTSLWTSIGWEMPSMVDRVSIGGVPYLYEVIPLVIGAK